MRACRYLSMILTGFMVLAVGCRGTRPQGGLVQVTEEPTTDVAGIDPVPQRLVTAQRKDRGSDAKEPGNFDGNTSGESQVSRALKRAGARPNRDSAKPSQDPANQFSRNTTRMRSRSDTIGSLAGKSKKPATPTEKPKTTSAQQDTAIRALMAANQGKPQPRQSVASGQQPRATRKTKPVIASQTRPSANKIAAEAAGKKDGDAFAISSPDVQARAIQRFVAAVAKTADRTVQPNSLKPALAKSLNNLPELPPATNRTPSVPPKRLAMSKPNSAAKPTATPDESYATSASITDDMAVVHVMDLSKPKAPVERPPAKAAETEAVAVAPPVSPAKAPASETESTAVAVEAAAIEAIAKQSVTTKEPVVSLELEAYSPKPIVQPLALPPGIESTAQKSTGDNKTMIRPVVATSDVDGKVTQAVARSERSTSDELEIPLPPLSLATAAPMDDFAELDAIAVTAATTSAAEPAQTPANPEFLSDEELYKVLLTRLTTPGIDETEAERSRRLIIARHLMVLAGNPDDAATKLDGLSEQEQAYLRHQLTGLWKMIDPKGHPVAGRRFSSALTELREATKHLAAATDALEVRSLSFCTEIEAYGQIKTFPGNRFQPGQQVILYCEVENFTSTKIEQGFETHLQGSYDVFNAENEKVVSQLLPADRQVASKYLRDYFIAYQMHLPKQLPPGTYRLQLTMEDVPGQKYGQASIPFEIAE